MSILSSPMGKPHRVVALVRLLRAAGSHLPQRDVERWLAPALRTKMLDRDELTVLVPNEAQITGASQTIGAARSLGLIFDHESGLTLTPDVPDAPHQIAAWTHARLASVADEHPDAIVFRVYAWFVVEVERRQGYAGLTRSGKELANDIEATLNPERRGDEPRQFNPTKLTPWREWMAFAGLGMDTMPSLPSFMPAAAPALRALLVELGRKRGFGVEIDAGEAIDALAVQAPYIDRGRLFDKVAKLASHHVDRGKLSIVVSDALRSLHEDGVIELKTIGDARHSLRLSGFQGQTPTSVVSIVVKAEIHDAA
jgi:hypothetical protein